MKDSRIKIGVIGLGRMGKFYLEEMKKSGKWNIAYICDVNPEVRKEAERLAPEGARIIADEQDIFRLSDCLRWQTNACLRLKRRSVTVSM